MLWFGSPFCAARILPGIRLCAPIPGEGEGELVGESQKSGLRISGIFGGMKLAWTEGEAMDGAGSVLFDGLEVLCGAVSFVGGKSVLRILGVVLDH